MSPFVRRGDIIISVIIIVDQLNDAGSHENTKRTPLPFCNPLTNFDHLNGGGSHENTKRTPLPFCKPVTNFYHLNGGRYHENTKLKPLPFCKPLTFIYIQGCIEFTLHALTHMTMNMFTTTLWIFYCLFIFA